MRFLKEEKVKAYTIEDIEMSTTCAMCGKTGYANHKIEFPFKMFCSDRCVILFQEYEEHGWPDLSGEEWAFWKEVGKKWSKIRDPPGGGDVSSNP